MNYDVITTDKNTLPQALVEPFKRWQRITFCDDDLLCAEILQGAIDQFERTTEITVFASTVVLEPAADDYACGSGSLLRLPVTPINTIAVVDGAAAPLAYPLTSRGIHGVRIYQLAGAFVDGMSITIETGFTAATITPEIRQAVFQIAGHFYEYREILNATNVGEPSMWLNQIMAGFWLPRV